MHTCFFRLDIAYEYIDGVGNMEGLLSEKALIAQSGYSLE